MTDLAGRIAAAAANGSVATLPRLTTEAAQTDIAVIATGSLAPVLAQALTSAVRRDVPGWQAALGSFIDGLAAQHSLLALAGSVDELLASPVVVGAYATRLHDVLLHDLESVAESDPLLAAGRLEGAVRLAVSDAVAPFAVLGSLTTFRQDDREEFTESLPRLLGAAMDRWAGESAITGPLRDALDRLRHVDSASVGAAFELACDGLRTALTAHTMPEAMAAITSARSRFRTVQAAEETRHDSGVYVAACDAILAFAAHDQIRLADAARRLDEAIDQRSAWSRGMHQPPWRRPRLAGDHTWQRLVLLLQAASARLSETIWMDVWEALGAVLDAYAQARTLRPMPGLRAAPGLVAMVEPAIENAILRRQSLLAALRRSVVEARRMDSPPIDARTAGRLLERIEATGENPDDEEDDAPDGAERLHRLAPTLVRALGEQHAANLTAGINDEALRLLGGVLHGSDRSSTAHPVLDPLLDDLLGRLSGSARFTGQIRTTFGLLLEQTLRFLASRADITTRTWGLHRQKDKDYRRLLRKGERRPLEADLQQDYYQWLATGQLGGLASVETPDLAMGRADVIVGFGAIRYVTEIKRETSSASRADLEAKYLRQAAEYSNTNVPFGQLLVLDLTPHPEGAPRLDESVWLAHHRPPGATTDRTVLIGVVAGNRPTPHDLSTNRHSFN